MRVPILTGLLLASAWTACAQFNSNPSSTPSNSISTVTTTTPSSTVSTGAVFEFVAFSQKPGEKRVYYQNENPSPYIHIKLPTSSYQNIQLYIRGDDGDNVADTITGVTNDSGSKNGLISVIPIESRMDVELNFKNIVASWGGYAFFLVLQANASSGISNMDGEELENLEISPLFAVVENASSDMRGFEGEDLSSSESAEINDGLASGPPVTGSNSALNPTATAVTSSSSKSKNSSGLATGAIAGIAVGAAVVLILVLALAWFLLRRRKQQHPTDVSTPLAAGYGGAAAASSREFMGDKEAGAMVAESPQSQAYTDQPDPRHSTLSGAAIIGNATAAPADASYTESGHQAYDEAAPAGHSPTDQQPPHRSSTSGMRGLDSPAPSTSVARHLVDEDMTADEIARLEEEERELDRQIQEAGRRRP